MTTERDIALAHYQIERDRHYNQSIPVLELDLRAKALAAARGTEASNAPGLLRQRDFLLSGYRHALFAPLLAAENRARYMATADARAEVEAMPDAASREVAYVAKVKQLYAANPGWGEPEPERIRRLQAVALVALEKVRPWLFLHIAEAPGDGVPAHAAGVGARSPGSRSHEGGPPSTRWKAERAKNPRIDSSALGGRTPAQWATALYRQAFANSPVPAPAPTADTIARCSDGAFRAVLLDEFQKIEGGRQ